MCNSLVPYAIFKRPCVRGCNKKSSVELSKSYSVDNISSILEGLQRSYFFIKMSSLNVTKAFSLLLLFHVLNENEEANRRECEC